MSQTRKGSHREATDIFLRFFWFALIGIATPDWTGSSISGRIELLHPEAGYRWRELWLSNVRWVDRGLLSLTGKDGVYRATDVAFCT